MTRAALLGLLLALCASGSAPAASPTSVALGKLTHQYHFELIAQACARQGLLDPAVIVAMQRAEARYARMLPLGTDVTAAKARVARDTRSVADGIGPSAKLFCKGMATQVF